ncbi:hypothetical protein [Bosea sp. 117]|uniref:DUF4231 domain-containing protein n=1 Tax=Bosea sp. 117 TaxID=1125973 RepID=UPI00068DA688|nr:hypothetical protein [Bosea sp. 117]
MITRPPKPTLALTVGVVGHRLNKLPADASSIALRLADAFRAVDAACSRFHAAHGELFAPEAPRLRLMTGYAEGADQLAIHQRPHGWRIAAVLPFPRERYREDFAPGHSGDGGDGRAAFDALLALADTVTELPGARAVPQRRPEDADDATAYAEVGAFLLRQADILVAVWDGARSAGAGGTAEVIGKAVEAGIPVICIDTDGAAPQLLLERAHVAHAAGRPAADEAAIAAVVERMLALIERPTELHDEASEHRVPASSRLATFLKERWRPVCRWTTYDWLRRGARPWNWRLRLRATPPGEGYTDWSGFLAGAPRGGGSLERIADVLHPRFLVANNLATHFSHVYRSAYILIYLLALLAVAIALYSLLPFDDHGDRAYALEHKAVLVLVELMIVGLIILLVYLGRRRSWHDRWVDYRALAEMLRHLRFLSLLGEYGGTRPGHAPLTNAGTEWVVWYVRATSRELGVPGAVFDADYQRRALTATWDTEVKEQIDYNLRNAHELSHLRHRLHLWGDICFFGTAGVLTIFLLVFGFDHLLPGTGVADLLYAVKPYVSFAAAFLPALGAAFASINFTGDFEGFARRSAQTAHGLEELEADYRHALEELDLETTSDTLVATARIMTEDISFWQSLYSHKRLTLPS